MGNEEFAQSVEDNLFFSFNVKYRGTEDNKRTKEKFKKFAKEQTDDSYILAIKRLLEYYEEDIKYKKLLEEIGDLRAKIEEVAESLEEKASGEVVKTFG